MTLDARDGAAIRNEPTLRSQGAGRCRAGAGRQRGVSDTEGMLWVMTTHGIPYLDNPILNTDSYKASHWLQYPPGTDATFFYVESRGGTYDKHACSSACRRSSRHASVAPITHADVDEARDFFAAHGEPFNESGWRRIVDVHGGTAADAHPRGARRQRGADAPGAGDDRVDRSRGLLAAVLPGNPAAAPLVPGDRGHDQLARQADVIRQYLERTSDAAEAAAVQAARLRRARCFQRRIRRVSAAWHTWSTSMGTDTVSGVLAARALLRRADGRLLDSRRRTQHDHQLGPRP